MDENCKYIIRYKNNESIDYKKILEDDSFDIINLIDINYDKKIESDIYFDDDFEELIFNNCSFIIYEYEYKTSNKILDLLRKYKKKILYGSLEDIRNQYKEENIDKLINDFSNYYENLKKLSEFINKNNIHFEIKNNIELTDSIKSILFMYYEKNNNNIINTIQKKSITENLKNKNISKIVVIGKNLEEEIEEFNNENIDLYKFEGKLDFYNLINIINDKYKNDLIIFCRCDIVIPTQNSFDNFYYEFLLNKNLVYAVSRIDRLINGNLQKNNNLNNILFSSEQDCWIFKSPLLINDLNNLKNIFINDLFSELYFNKILKDNDKVLINNTKNIKIIRLNCDNNIENRELINKDNNIKNTENI